MVKYLFKNFRFVEQGLKTGIDKEAKTDIDEMKPSEFKQQYVKN
jgi:hypothetical protein